MNDLSIRLRKFAVDAYVFSGTIKKDARLIDNINQLIRSSASPGANYNEAQSAVSRRDFHNKIRICLKEMRESQYWLLYFYELQPETKEIVSLLQESDELCRILSAIAFKTQTR
jgi:four helix bundle protein